MSPDQVPAEWVELAARALRDEQCTGRDHGTDACPDRHCRDDSVLPWYRDRVREPLAAVLPLHEAAVRAAELTEAADELEWQMRDAGEGGPLGNRSSIHRRVLNFLRYRAASVTSMAARLRGVGGEGAS